MMSTIFCLVGAAGFEPATTRTPSVCATRLRHAPTHIHKRGPAPYLSRLSPSFHLSLRETTQKRTRGFCRPAPLLIWPASKYSHIGLNPAMPAFARRPVDATASMI